MNETDRELLEWAAKAAGYDYLSRDGRISCDPPHEHVLRQWNPLTDDGDAFRLAHAVPMIITPGTARLLDGSLFGVDNKDIAATRRAIVEAAAEIGRSME